MISLQFPKLPLKTKRLTRMFGLALTWAVWISKERNVPPARRLSWRGHLKSWRALFV